MERKFYTDNFEQLLKEKSDEFRMYPSKRVWHSIYNDLHPGRKWPSVAVSMLLIIALLMVGYWNNNDTNSANTAIASVSAEQKNTSTISQYNISFPSGNGQTTSQVPINNNIAAIQQQVNNAKNIAAISKLKKYLPVSTKNNVIALNINEAGVLKENMTLQQSADKKVVTTATTDLQNKDAAINAIADLTNKNDDRPVISGIDNITDINELNALAVTKSIVSNEATDKSLGTNALAAKTTLSPADKAWMEDFALHNKLQHNKWKERTTIAFYLTPNVVYRNLTNDPKYNVAAAAPPFASSSGNANNSVTQKPGLGLEAGIGITYSLAKKLRIKAGVQANYTNYSAKLMKLITPYQQH